jgi:hypothetical protein
MKQLRTAEHLVRVVDVLAETDWEPPEYVSEVLLLELTE